MCVSCGCGMADIDHGNPRNITYADLASAASLDGVSVNDILKNINKTVVGDRLENPDKYTVVPKLEGINNLP